MAEVVLRAVNADAADVEIELLRSVAWQEARRAAVGAVIQVELPELHVRGLTRVLAVGSAPGIEPGTGTVITGRFTHVSDDLLDVWVEGLAEPIGCTSRHPFWSVTRERWLPAHALSPGEWLEAHGKRVQVVSVNFRASGERLRRSVTPTTR